MSAPRFARDGVTASVWSSLDGSSLWEFLPPAARPDPDDHTQWTPAEQTDNEDPHMEEEEN